MENEQLKFLNNLSIENMKQKKNNIKELINKKLYIIIIFSLIIIIILTYILFSKNSNDLNIRWNIGNNTGNYSLYNLFKYPTISILLPNIELFEVSNYSIVNFINNLRNQTLKEIQIFISFSNIEYYNDIKNICLLDDRIKVYFLKKINTFYDFYYLIEKSNGKFIFLLDKIEYLNNDEIEQFYNYTKGKINNIFEFKTSNGNVIYLIRSKILKTLIDNNLYFKNFSKVINYLYLYSKPKLNYISIALCPDNYYTSYTYVAMISILNSKYYFTYICFYLIITDDFEQKNVDFLSSLYEQYDLFNITFINMDNRYNVAYISRYLTKQTYYRFSLGELIPYLNKIIYLDTDILVYNDLTEFFNLNFNGKIILGHPTIYNKSQRTGIFKINNGILLLNLNKMRKIKLEKKVLYIINNGFKNDLHDQFLLNQFFYEFIGIFPPKYHVRPWNNYNEMIQFNINSGMLYDNDYLYFSYKYPTIIHYAYYSKPLYENISQSEDWWYFARKSKYYNEKSCNLSSIFKYIYN